MSDRVEPVDPRQDLAARAVALTAELVAMDTVNPGLVPGAAGERRAVLALADRLRRNGLDVEVVEAGGADRPSLLATHRGSRPGRSLVLNGHLDTVGVAGMDEPFTARVVEDRMYGRGTADMKAGVAGLVLAAEAAAATDTPGEIVLALVADEEDASLGTEAVLDALSRRESLPEACLVGEPTGLDLAVAHRGFALVEVLLRGRAAHSSQPEEGVNAVTHLGRLLHAVELADAELARRRGHPRVGRGSLLATVASGGSSPFVLAAEAVAVVERRTVPGESAAVALQEVEALVAALRGSDPTVSAGLAELATRDAWEHDGASAAGELQAHLVEGLEAAGRPAPTEVGAPYWMESALWEAAGVPTAVCGPSGGGLHAVDEWVDLTQVRAFPAAVLHAATRFCAGEAS